MLYNITSDWSKKLLSTPEIQRHDALFFHILNKFLS